MIPTYSYNPREEVQFIVLKKDATYLFAWIDFDMPKSAGAEAPQFTTWATFLDHLHADSIRGAHDATTFALIGNDLVIDDSRDNFKWPAARTPFSLETTDFISEALTRKLIQPDTRVFLGNWANKDGVYAGNAGQILSIADDPTITLYHGTSTHRWKHIQQKGLKPAAEARQVWKRKTNQDAVYFSGTAERAMYFARHTAEKDGQELKSAARKLCLPIVIKTRVARADHRLIADDDWLDRNPDKNRQDYAESLTQFGQVGLLGTVAPQSLQEHDLLLRKGNPLFLCRTRFANQKVLEAV